MLIKFSGNAVITVSQTSSLSQYFLHTTQTNLINFWALDFVKMFNETSLQSQFFLCINIAEAYRQLDSQNFVRARDSQQQ